jgi:hypothetical protein
MEAVTVNAHEMKWAQAADYPTGTEEKVLSMGGSIAPRATLLKLPAGWRMDRNSHRFTTSETAGGLENGQTFTPLHRIALHTRR